MYRQAIRSFSTTTARANLAKFTGIGRIGNDLEIVQANTGRNYIKYGLAVNGPKESTSWFNIVVFDERAIDYMSKYLNKGSRVYVEADMSMQAFNDGEETRRSLNLVQREIRNLGTKKTVEDTEHA